MRKLLVSVGIIVLSTFALPTAASNADEIIATMHSNLNMTRPSECPSRWCACFMNLVLDALGYQTSGTNRAKDFANYGEPANPGETGSIMVMRNHVGIVVGMCSPTQVQIISGNYSRRVTYGCEPASKAIAWRNPIK